MEYIYKNASNENIILNFPIGEAPSKTTFEGIKYERDFTAELQDKDFCLKGSGWPGQDTKRKSQMTVNNNSAGKRTKGTWGEAKRAIPNYKGQECSSWKEAANLASKDKEK